MSENQAPLTQNAAVHLFIVYVLPCQNSNTWRSDMSLPSSRLAPKLKMFHVVTISWHICGKNAFCVDEASGLTPEVWRKRAD